MFFHFNYDIWKSRKMVLYIFMFIPGILGTNRIIGLPGETIQRERETVIVNSKIIKEYIMN